jgi:uncharacterized protein YaeQ
MRLMGCRFCFDIFREFVMALNATIFKCDLQIADMDRNYYGDHALTLARHPSETDERLMIRLLAFALNADPQLQFTRGLSSSDEPDLWRHELSGEIDLWIEVGLPDERRIRKACGRARKVFIYAYGGRGASIWWQGIASQLSRFDNLTVFNIPKATGDALTALCQRNMKLNASIQEGQLWLASEHESVEVVPERWL